jgi:hypothetical protein
VPSDSNQSDRKRQYVVLEETTILALIDRQLPQLDLGDSTRESLAKLGTVYRPLEEITAYNADRASEQVGQRFARQETLPRLAAVPTRNWNPKDLVVENADPKVRVA